MHIQFRVSKKQIFRRLSHSRGCGAHVEQAQIWYTDQILSAETQQTSDSDPFCADIWLCLFVNSLSNFFLEPRCPCVMERP